MGSYYKQNSFNNHERNKCAILVSSCDKNEDLWKMFFYYLNKNWANHNMNLYLNTESKIYKDSIFHVTCFQFNDKKMLTQWSYGLKLHLKKIPEKYILLILDDFFLTDTVDHNEVMNCVEAMEQDDKISLFLFESTPGPNLECDFNRFELKGKKSPYRFSLQIGLWRKDALIRYLREHESPWQFESWGTIRSRRYHDKFYSLKPNAKKVFKYPGSGVLCDGKWNAVSGEDNYHFIQDTFDIDFSKRGVYHLGDDRKWSIGNRSFLKKAIGVIKSLI